MARVMHIFTVVRNNWKKTIVGVAAVSYGTNYAREKYRTFEMMHDYCAEALTHGEETIPVSMKGRNVTVILNPVANRRKAKKEFEKFCAPLLHLSGVSVTVIQTEIEGHARHILETLPADVDAVVVAGGDGTLSEVVTGLLRRPDADTFAKNVPVGILPLGRTNSVANKLLSPYISQHPKMLAEATMAVVKGAYKPMDVVKIDRVEPGGETSDSSQKPVYSVSGLEWGPFRDAKSRRDKYWYWGSLRGYASYLFTAFKGESAVTWSCEGLVEVSPPCDGCSNCIDYRADLQPEVAKAKPRRWWSVFTPRTSPVPTPGGKSTDYSKIINKDCATRETFDLSASELSVFTSNVTKEEQNAPQSPHMAVSLGPREIGFFNYILEGWRRESGDAPSVDETLYVKQIYMWPKNLGTNVRENEEETNQKDKQQWISIDSEDYEIRALRLTLYPNRVKFFTPRLTEVQ